jgi:hypothetical protein
MPVLKPLFVSLPPCHHPFHVSGIGQDGREEGMVFVKGFFVCVAIGDQLFVEQHIRGLESLGRIRSPAEVN